MSEALESYSPVSLAAFFRWQAWVVWAATLGVTVVWVGFILAAPVAKAFGWNGFADADYGFFGHICHQMPERSFFLDGHPLAVCARCFGVYLGLVAGSVGYPLIRGVETIEPLPRFWLLLAMVPIGVDWALGALDIWANTHGSRFVTGLILGFACALYIMPAMVEIARLAVGRGKRKKAA